MTREQYQALDRICLDVGHLSELLDQLGRSFEDDQQQGALRACAELARQITYKVASVPGFDEAESRGETKS